MPTLSASEIAGYAQKAGVTGQNIVIATAIALAESSGDTDAINTANRNGSTDYGLWQINSVHSALLNGHNWRDPADNAAMMYSISNGGKNWSPWSSYKSGAYLAHLGAAGVTPDSSVTGGVTTVGSTSNPFTALQNFAQIISNPHTWVRLGLIVGGGLMLMSALHISVPVPIPVVGKIVKAATNLQGSVKG
jgi:hypothetical protein